MSLFMHPKKLIFALKVKLILTKTFDKEPFSQYVFIGRRCEYKTQSERYFGGNIQPPICKSTTNSLS